MPSQRKRIGYLPKKYVHELIEHISKQRSISQSKVVGILVEEALISRGYITKNISELISEKNEINNHTTQGPEYTNESYDELVSDSGISYNNPKDRKTDGILMKDNNTNKDEDILLKFKQFLAFQRFLEDRTNKEI